MAIRTVFMRRQKLFTMMMLVVIYARNSENSAQERHRTSGPGGRSCSLRQRHANSAEPAQSLV